LSTHGLIRPPMQPVCVNHSSARSDEHRERAAENDVNDPIVNEKRRIGAAEGVKAPRELVDPSGLGLAARLPSCLLRRFV